MTHHSFPRPKLPNAAGFTLIEISLVMALLLSLLYVVFLGMGPYRENAARAGCRMQLAAVQKAVRSHANMTGMRITDPLDEATEVFGGPSPVMAVKPVCPGGGTYTWQTSVPPIGVPYGDCSGTTPAHTLAGSVAEW